MKKISKKTYQKLKNWLLFNIDINEIKIATIIENERGSLKICKTKFLVKQKENTYKECITQNNFEFKLLIENEKLKINDARIFSLEPITPYLTEEEKQTGFIKRYRLEEIYHEINNLPYDYNNSHIMQLKNIKVK